MQYITTSIVQKKQVDGLRHLNHVYALQILEYARDDWYAEAGLWDGRVWTADESISSIVLNVNFNYRLECFLNDELKIITSPVDRGNKSFTLAQKVVRDDGKIAIDGTATSLVMNMQTHETIQVPDCLSQHLPLRS